VTAHTLAPTASEEHACRRWDRGMRVSMNEEELRVEITRITYESFDGS
jgi:hypothetical protein